MKAYGQSEVGIALTNLNSNPPIHFGSLVLLVMTTGFCSPSTLMKIFLPVPLYSAPFCSPQNPVSSIERVSKRQKGPVGKYRENRWKDGWPGKFRNQGPCMTAMTSFFVPSHNPTLALSLSEESEPLKTSMAVLDTRS